MVITSLLMWLNVSVATLNATLQLLLIYRLVVANSNPTNVTKRKKLSYKKKQRKKAVILVLTKPSPLHHKENKSDGKKTKATEALT